MRRATLVALVALCLGLAGVADATAAPIFSSSPRALPGLPAGAKAPIDLLAVDCTSPGYCAAGGLSTGGRATGSPSDNTGAIVANERGGRWGAAATVTLPPDAQRGTNPQFARVDGVACAAPGDCAAVGDYFGADDVMVVPETGGVWRQAQGLALPSDYNRNVQDVSLNSIACPSAGNCIAVGHYERASASPATTNDGPVAALVIAQRNGVWAPGTAITSPAGATRTELSSIACPAAGACVAVGQATVSGDNVPVVAVQRAGRWIVSTRRLPAGAATSKQAASLKSVACAAPGSCVAGGDYTTSAGLRPMLMSTVNGSFGNATAFPLPAEVAATGENASVDGVSCAAVGECVLVGDYVDDLDQTQGMHAEQNGGAWSRPVYAGEPTDAPEPYSRDAALLGVDCPSLNGCSAVGDYAAHSYANAVPMTVDAFGRLGIPAQALPPATVGQPYSVQLAAVGGTGNFSWFNFTPPPVGLNIGSSGLLSGTPTTVGTTTFTAYLIDSGPPDQRSSRKFTLTVNPAPPPAATRRRPPRPALRRVSLSPKRFVRAGVRRGRRCVAAPASHPTKRRGRHHPHPKRHKRRVHRHAAAVGPRSGHRGTGHRDRGHPARNRPCARPVRIHVRYSLSRAARVSVTVSRQAGGRRVTRRCVRPTRHNRRHHACTRWVRVKGTLRLPGRRGVDRWTFKGAVAHHTLGRGDYRLMLTPRSAGGRGRSVTVRFTIR